MHPSEIATELRKFGFFKSLPEDVVLQISTMMETVSFKTGENLLKDGEKSTRLFFLRRGQVELMVVEETISSFFTPGDVMGEISVISGKASTVTLQASKDTECFAIDTTNFNLILPKNKDAFFSHLYKLYALILCERLEKTAAKARFFEMAHRELHEAQMRLEQAEGKTALLIQTDKKQLVLTKTAVGGTGLRMDVGSTIEEGLEKALAFKYDVVICDEATVEVVQRLKERGYVAQFVLLLSRSVVDNLSTLSKMMDVDFVITRDPDDRQMTVKTILIALSKILNKDHFGMEKYLSWGVVVQSRLIKGSNERDSLKEDMVAHFKASGIRSSIIDRCFTVVEELLMNAIYDAPTDPHGTALYNHLPRKQVITLDTHLQSNFKFATDGNMVALSVIDPFGSLTKEVIVKYLKSCYDGQAGSLNEGKGGAGRGLHQIIENADLTIFNVKKGQKTEVISLFSLEHTRRAAYPTFHYFFQP